jgi:hypothetical protein
MFEPGLEARNVRFDLLDEAQMPGQIRQARVGLDPLRVQVRRAGGDECGIERIVFGSTQTGPGIGPNLDRLQGEAGLAQMPDDAALVSSGRLDADARDAGRGQPGGEGAPARQSVDDLPAFHAAVNHNVEGGFGCIDSRRRDDKQASGVWPTGTGCASLPWSDFAGG